MWVPLNTSSNFHDQRVRNPLVRAAGRSRSTAPWAGRGTPSLPCHQITSSCLEVSLLNERPWVRPPDGVLLQFCRCDAWNIFSFSLVRWCLAVLRQQERMETFQTQSHRETEASPVKASTSCFSALDHISDNHVQYVCIYNVWCVCFRLWHTACSGPDGEVFVFGGCANNLLAQQRAVRASS